MKSDTLAFEIPQHGLTGGHYQAGILLDIHYMDAMNDAGCLHIPWNRAELERRVRMFGDSARFHPRRLGIALRGVRDKESGDLKLSVFVRTDSTYGGNPLAEDNLRTIIGGLGAWNIPTGAACILFDACYEAYQGNGYIVPDMGPAVYDPSRFGNSPPTVMYTAFKVSMMERPDRECREILKAEHAVYMLNGGPESVDQSAVPMLVGKMGGRSMLLLDKYKIIK